MSGDLTRAIADYSAAIQRDPGFAPAYNNRGFCRCFLDDYDHALADLSRVMELDPMSSNPYSIRGHVQRRKGDYDRAVADYSRAVELDPDDEYARIWLLLTLRRVPEALATGYREDFRTLVRTRKSLKFIRTVSKYLLGMGGLTEKGVLDEARRGKNQQEVRDRLCEAYFYLGKERSLKGDRVGAEEFFGKTLETAVYDFDEYQEAKAELRDMQR
jgi:lipoprotein NlpI